jgi:choline dehydrogenase-like flavoprotein
MRMNAAFTHLAPARPRPNLSLLADALVEHVCIEGGRATGVRLADGREVRGRQVVLCAGAYGSPAILLRSGFDAPVGEGLADHVGVGLEWEPTPVYLEECEAFAAARPIYMAGVTLRAGDVFFFPAADPPQQPSAAVFLMKPRSRGRVRLTSADSRAPLAIEHGFLDDRSDAEPIADGIGQIRDLVAQPELARYVVREARPGDARLDVYVRAAKRGFFHPTGTCAMGVVVDGRCRVIGAENVVVGDASVMPTIPRANTNLTVAAVAERLAEFL